jgi:hypothetical protein
MLGVTSGRSSDAARSSVAKWLLAVIAIAACALAVLKLAVKTPTLPPPPAAQRITLPSKRAEEASTAAANYVGEALHLTVDDRFLALGCFNYDILAIGGTNCANLAGSSSCDFRVKKLANALISEICPRFCRACELGFDRYMRAISPGSSSGGHLEPCTHAISCRDKWTGAFGGTLPKGCMAGGTFVG